MIDSAKLSGRALRRYISEVLVTDGDLNAFCLDYYREIYRQFANGMQRDAKLDLLLATADAVQIFADLHEANPTRAQRFEYLFKDAPRGDTPKQIDPPPPPRQLSREEILDELCALSLPSFEEVEFRMQLNRAQSASSNLPQNQRAMALIRQAEQDQEGGLKRLTATIDKVRAALKRP